MSRQAVSKIDLKPGAHVHMMGVCGTAMGSLAGLLKDRGYEVTGSDQNVYPPMSTQLEKIGIKIMEGYKRENLTKHGKPDLVIVGNVISKQYEEAQALLESDIPFMSLPQAMGQLLIADRHSIVVSGTHGKTTTTSLLSWVTDQLGLQPGFMIGGIPKNFDFSYRVPKGDWFVIEGDEYDTAFFDKVPKFIHYRPRSVILTSVEFDHADIYRDLDHVKEAFQRLLQLIPAGGVLVTAAEDANIADLLQREKTHLASGGRKVVTFGMTKGDYQARSVTASATGTEFDVQRAGKPDQRIKMQLIGEYNVKNALAAFALGETLGFELSRLVKAIETFQGVKRRQEIIGKPNDITIIEDFAHHPTAVKQTIQTVQSRYPKSRVYSVFEARSATSRRNVFQNEYADALGIAHAVVMPQPFNQASIPEDQRFSSDKLIGELKAKGVDANLENDVDGIVATLKKKAKPGDVILIMSNGGFGGIYEKLLKTLAVFALVFMTLFASGAAEAASLACFDETSYGAGKWVKVDLKQLPNGKFDVSMEWSTGATSVTRNMNCNLAVIGSSPALVDGSCDRSNQTLDFRAGQYEGTMTIVEDLTRTLGTAFKCERVKKLTDGLFWSGASEFGIDTSTFQSGQRLF